MVNLNAPGTRIPGLIDRLPAFEQEVTSSLRSVWAAEDEELYLVGGVVRDLLLGRPGADLDFATSTTPDQTRRLARHAHVDALYDIGETYGTIGLIFHRNNGPDLVAELTTYRSEVYPTRDRRPTVTHGVSLDDDLSRRDFTINAMALDPLDETIVDPFGGINDLNQRRINAVGNPVERFDEDPLRILRAARFSAELEFDIEPETFLAMQAMGPELLRISVERIAAELNRLLIAPGVERGLRALEQTGTIAYILPEILKMVEDDQLGGTARHKDIWEHTIQVTAQSPPRLAVRWAALLHDAAKPQTRSFDERGKVHFYGHEPAGARLASTLLRRLNQEKELQKRVPKLVDMHLRPSGYSPDWTDSAVRRLALEAGDAFEDLLDLAAADVTSAREHRRQAAARRVAGLREHYDRLEAERALEDLQSPLDGNELMAMFDRPPGRWIAIVKDQLREMVIDGDLAPDDKETAAKLAQEWVEETESREDR